MSDIDHASGRPDPWQAQEAVAEHQAQARRDQAQERAQTAAMAADPLRQDRLDKVMAKAPPSPLRKTPFALALLLAVGLLGIGGWHHWERRAAATATQAETIDFVPRVRTVTAKADGKAIRLTLPGETQAFDKAEIFPRATGYIAERRVDIGSRVKKGDLLVRIAAPDLDQQLSQALAQFGQEQAQLSVANAEVDQAHANLHLADVTDGRTSRLAGQGWASQQNADQTKASALAAAATLTAAQAKVKVAEANLQAQQATVDRLKALTAFERVVAPFDGIVTDRQVDIGDLVKADNGTQTPMFVVESDDVLRVAVQVPQSAAVGIHEGVKAFVTVPQIPGRSFAGTVSRSSVALRASSRTLFTQIDVKNPDGVLRPGLYVSVTFEVPRTHPSITIPEEALIFAGEGTQVAVLDSNDKIRLTPVRIARDLGATLELGQGLAGGERLVMSPPADLQDDARVTPIVDTDGPSVKVEAKAE